MNTEDLIIDTHAHLYPERFLDLIEDQKDTYPVQIVRNKEGLRVLLFYGREFLVFHPNFYRADVRLAEMAASNVDFQVLSIALPIVYWADAELGRELCQVYNDELAAVVKMHSDKFVGLAAVPLQDPPSAVRELERAVKNLGMRGCLIGSNIDGRDLDAEEFEAFFAASAELDAPIYIHPILPAGGERMWDYRLDVLLGFPLDTTLAAARIVFSGILERYPNLKIVLSHLGGALPFLSGRLAKGSETFEGVEKRISGDAGEYFQMFYLDTIAYAPEVLTFGTRWIGTERIVFGTDSPFFGAQNLRDCLSLVKKSPDLSQEEKRAILTETPKEIFKIDTI
ncbi:MAG: amidohydrolase family protein [Deltaproteobacteria bacterium]|nr:amidohydrolase family protein [Deltaproteobacteria bacterium]